MLEWINSDIDIFTCKYTSGDASLFVVLVESVKPGRKVDTLDPVCILDMFLPIIRDGNSISNSGINQLKVECYDWRCANKLVDSTVS